MNFDNASVIKTICIIIVTVLMFHVVLFIHVYVLYYRASIEEQYAKSLAKLAKSTLGDNEEG